jgi:hypothetical protein
MKNFMGGGQQQQQQQQQQSGGLQSKVCLAGEGPAHRIKLSLSGQLGRRADAQIIGMALSEAAKVSQPRAGGAQ